MLELRIPKKQRKNFCFKVMNLFLLNTLDISKCTGTFLYPSTFIFSTNTPLLQFELLLQPSSNNDKSRSRRRKKKKRVKSRIPRRSNTGRILVSKFCKDGKQDSRFRYLEDSQISCRVVNFVPLQGGECALLSMPLSRRTRQLIPVNYFLFTSASARVSLTLGSSVSRESEKPVPSRFAGAVFRLCEF